jgi:hypothetical protein
MTGKEADDMNDAQLGLTVAAPLIIVFTLALRWMGALRTSGTVAAVMLFAVIAIVLFFSQ